MTMKREAKTEILTRHAQLVSGEVREESASPRQLMKYGRYLPAEIGAKFYTSCKRRTRRRTRESWLTSRLEQRLRRVRVA